jgi:predicted RNase H-like nuclease (RuvC/YqgF family)
MITWKNDDRSLMNLDKKVTNAIQTLSIRVNGFQIDQQVEDSEKLDKIFKLLDNIPAQGLSQPTTIDPKILAEVARQAGCTTATEITSELENVGFELEKIQNAVAEIASKLDNMDHKLDDMTNLLSQSLENQKKQGADLMSMVMHSQAEIRRENQKTLQVMMQMKSGEATIKKVFSTNHQTKQLARRAAEIGSTPGVGLIIVHPNGVGMHSLVNINGEQGVNGRSGNGNMHGRNGENGTYNAIDGQDGNATYT